MQLAALAAQLVAKDQRITALEDVCRAAQASSIPKGSVRHEASECIHNKKVLNTCFESDVRIPLMCIRIQAMISTFLSCVLWNDTQSICAHNGGVIQATHVCESPTAGEGGGWRGQQCYQPAASHRAASRI